ncbi:MAG: Hsp20/alpha crystallin family protein [Promethearchaeota archaeon]
MVDFDDIFNELKDLFDFNSNIVDFDIYFFPDSEENLKLRPKKKMKGDSSRGIKVSYHYETGMDNPEVNIEGDFKEKEIGTFLNQFYNRFSNIKNIFEDKNSSIIDGNRLSLKRLRNGKTNIVEPYTEINVLENYAEILMEVPGIQYKDIDISFSKNGKKLIFSALNESKSYIKNINLPFKSSKEKIKIMLNNGIVILRIPKTN